MSISIRTARYSDEVSLRELSIASFVHAYAAHNTETDMQNYLATHFSEQAIQAELSDPSLCFLLAFEQEELVAYAKLVVADSGRIPDHKPIEIARLYTKPELIGGGIGVQMIKAIAEIAGAKGCDSICLDVWQKNFRAINFYQREGFRICGLTQFRLGDDLQDDFVMIRYLSVRA